MPKREIKHFPTPNNFFKNNGSAPQPWTANGLISWLQEQLKMVPESERASMVAEGCDGITLRYQTTITAEQLQQEKLQLLMTALNNVTTAGMSRDAVDQLLRQVHALS